jgi:hypothetical protein
VNLLQSPRSVGWFVKNHPFLCKKACLLLFHSAWPFAGIKQALTKPGYRLNFPGIELNKINPWKSHLMCFQGNRAVLYDESDGFRSILGLYLTVVLFHYRAY